MALCYGPASHAGQCGFEAVLEEKELEVAAGAVEWAGDREGV